MAELPVGSLSRPRTSQLWTLYGRLLGDLWWVHRGQKTRMENRTIDFLVTFGGSTNGGTPIAGSFFDKWGQHDHSLKKERHGAPLQTSGIKKLLQPTASGQCWGRKRTSGAIDWAMPSYAIRTLSQSIYVSRLSEKIAVALSEPPSSPEVWWSLDVSRFCVTSCSPHSAYSKLVEPSAYSKFEDCVHVTRHVRVDARISVSIYVGKHVNKTQIAT